jgi:hypothetical protein
MRIDIRDFLALALLASLATFGLTACGNVTTSSSFNCCLNGEYYECEDQEELDSCYTNDNQCERVPSKDDEEC